jgi:hypothetical protein
VNIQRSIITPVRQNLSWTARWSLADHGLIASWERGREKAAKDPALAARASVGELVVLPWKGGVTKATKTHQHGTFNYLAMLQGLRGEDLNIDDERESVRMCAITGMTITYSRHPAKLGAA